MFNLIQAEWQKLRRCQILLIGIVALTLCPVVQYGTQLFVAPEYRDAAFDFTKLFANVVWGNSQMFLPISLVMLGGWLIDREAASDTLKNIAVIPIPASKLLLAKLLLTAFCALLFGCYSILATLLTGFLVGLPGFSLSLLFNGGLQLIAAAFTSYLVCMPLILIFGQIRGAYLGGSILAFFLGYSMLFFKGGILLSTYPFSAALILVGFDMQEYNGAISKPSLLLAAAGLLLVIVVTVLLLFYADQKREVMTPPNNERHASRAALMQTKKKRAARSVRRF